MSKGDPSGVYVAQSVTSFDEVTAELRRIAAVMGFAKAGYVEFLNAVPTKLFEGLTVGADGTNWNPGSGQGVYTYYAGAWHKLG